MKLKTNIFKKVYSGIMDTLIFSSGACENTKVLDAILPRIIDEQKDKLFEFLTAIDTGIKDIDYYENEKEKDITFVTFHKGKDGELYALDLYNESEGTIKSIMLFIHAQMTIYRDGVIVVDELNVKLHPLLLKFIIDLFYNNSNAQLIYTTHDTTLMDKKGKVNLFTRPRRFGKTLALSMVKTYFEQEIDNKGNIIDNSHYFQSMKIMGAGEKYARHMGQYPVIFLSLKSAKQPDFEMAYDMLKKQIPILKDFMIK